MDQTINIQRLRGNAPIKDETACRVVEPCRTVTALHEDVSAGLLEAPRSLPPKYFYDGRGSGLFDMICDTPEYYPTRVEDSMLVQYAVDIIRASTPDLIIELGSGACRKTRRLFDACEQLDHMCRYAPFDVCEPMLIQAANELEADYDWLHTTPLLGDYHAGLTNIPVGPGTNLFIFLGSTIGNFDTNELQDFIVDLRKRMSPGDYFLLGADRVKDISVLNAAYNDEQGLTAEFNLNVLRVLNREMGSNFDLDRFEHLAFFNTEHSRIEMYLVSRESQDIRFNALQAVTRITEGERIMTEISRKFEKDELELLLEHHEFDLVRHFEADNDYFSLLLVRAR